MTLTDITKDAPQCTGNCKWQNLVLVDACKTCGLFEDFVPDGDEHENNFKHQNNKHTVMDDNRKFLTKEEVEVNMPVRYYEAPKSIGQLTVIKSVPRIVAGIWMVDVAMQGAPVPVAKLVKEEV